MSSRASVVHLSVVVGLFVVSGCRVESSVPPVFGDAGFVIPDVGHRIDAPLASEDAGPLPEGCVPEICDNEVDDDCDGVVEDGCGCIPGETSSCFAGRAENRGRGLCLDGVMDCSDGLEWGTWGDCVGDVAPVVEVCDVAELDEDCDGAANEGCECTGSEPLPCGVDEGACAAGVQECVDGLRGECVGATGPRGEECNAIDDDCDGLTDEGLMQACGTDEGECTTGTQTCTGGAWDACVGSIEPQDEACDGLDQDCDAMVDEDLMRACGSSVGACLPGMQVCADATWSACTGETAPLPEDCNSIDDDCDGMTDESLSRSCGTDTGECTAGRETCTAGAWGACTGSVGPTTEACDGSRDDDCDGMVDDGCGCITGRTRSCGTDVGACVAGTETCDAMGSWGTCTGATGAATETCNAMDDDCDGRTDEAIARSCGTDTGACVAGTETCAAGAFGACTGSTGPMTELCDAGMVDEDCDGTANEGCGCTSGMTRSCGTDVGACVAGTERCDLSGAWGACTGATAPAAETCNAVDDDCDGTVDDGLSRGCGSDVGECVAGTQTCVAGSYGTCVGEVRPATEVCDGTRDEDCDGTVDDGCGCTNGATRACGSDVGACMAGSQTCSSGMWGGCTGSIGPVAETCNAVDDDCDGAIDDGVTRACGTDTGECVAGTQTCSAGSFGACVGSVGPATELCDATTRDEDCDGAANEGCLCVTGATRSCGTDTGACTAGTETCSAAGTWGTCTGSVGPGTETCNDVDDDCDGTIDDGITRSCGTDVGACVVGTQTCSAGSYGACTGGVNPATEVCDAAMGDEDCDGLSNEGCACTAGQSRSCGTDVGWCVAGTETCNLMGVWGTCAGSTGPRAETCNGIDDDCDGMVDEGGLCTPPVVMCAAGMTAQVLTTVTVAGSGSDPDGGAVSYQWTVTSRPTGSTSNPTSPTSATTSFFLDAAGSYTLQLCVTDNEGMASCCSTTITSTPPGVLHVELSWAEAYGDVDLHVRNVTQTGTAGWYTINDCFFGNRTPDWGAVGAVANPTLDVDDVSGFGPENVTISNMPASGWYTVAVHDYCRASATGSGPITATVRIYCMSTSTPTWVSAPITLNQTDDWVTVAEVNWNTCMVRSINTRTNGSSIVGSTHHCEMSCTTDADCPATERCVRAMGGGAPRYVCYRI